jgi:DNA invertase Pin-like site-specific DNA recombinase
VLYYKPNIPLALIEAKDNSFGVGDRRHLGSCIAGRCRTRGGRRPRRDARARAVPCCIAKVLKRLDRGDVLIVTRLDRLARSTRDLLNILDDIAKRGAGFKSLHDAWADTTSAHGRLMVTILAGLAEFERELIRARTGEGRKRAKERGVRFGRPPVLTPHQRQEALARREAGETLMDIARSYGVSHPTISRL